MTKTIVEITGEKPTKTGRPQKETAVGRIKYTTSLRGEVVKWLKTKAVQMDLTPADLLEAALFDYRKKLEADF